MKPKHILVIRVSAMGDVAMTVPVLKQLLEQHPELRITVLTQQLLVPLFEPLERTIVYPFETKGRHKGLMGIYRAFRELKKQNSFHAVADLHNVLRSKILSFLFRSSGVKIATIDKGRKEKKELTARDDKHLVQLKTSFQRYADVFSELGFTISLDTKQKIYTRLPLPPGGATLFSLHKKHIGIAPFSKHEEKMYPPDKMKAVIRELLQDEQLQLFFLGGGKMETTMLKKWEEEFEGTVNLVGRFSFEEELAIISNMDALITMDSANMHLASLYGVPVISIWGATHPYAGFYGWAQPASNAVQTELFCRPCSVFGNKPCYRGDHACMEQLHEEYVIEKVFKVLDGAEADEKIDEKR